MRITEAGEANCGCSLEGLISIGGLLNLLLPWAVLGDDRSILKSGRSPHRSPFSLLSGPTHPPYLLRVNPPPQPQCSSPVSLPPSNEILDERPSQD